MLVIHNGTQMWPTTNSPKRYSPGDNVVKPDGNFHCPAAAGADLGGGWVMAELIDADPVPDGETLVSSSTQMVGGVPKMVNQTRTSTQAELDAARVLSPAKFAYLLASTGLEQVWADVETYCKANDTATYALLKAHGAATEFHLTKTLQVLASMKPLTDQIAPGVDLSEATIRTEWAAAEAVVIGDLL